MVDDTLTIRPCVRAWMSAAVARAGHIFSSLRSLSSVSVKKLQREGGVGFLRQRLKQHKNSISATAQTTLIVAAVSVFIDFQACMEGSTLATSCHAMSPSLLYYRAAAGPEVTIYSIYQQTKEHLPPLVTFLLACAWSSSSACIVRRNRKPV